MTWMTLTLALSAAHAEEGTWGLAADRYSVTTPAGEVVALPCEVRQVLVVDRTAWLACAEDVVKITLDAEGRASLPAVRPLGEPITRLEIRGGEVVAVTGQPDPVWEAPASPQRGPMYGGPAQPAVTGEVTGLEGERAVIDIGKRDGVQGGSFVELYVEQPATSLDDGITEERSVGYGKVVAATDDKALVHMSINQPAQEGALVRVLPKRPASFTLGPPRLGGRGYVGVNVRGIIGPGFNEGAMLADAVIGYRAKFPMAVEVRMNPAVLGGDERGGFGNSSFVAMLSIDHQWFAIGGGGGVSLTDEGDAYGVWAHMLRFGPQDGLQFTARLQLKGTRSTFNDYVYWEVDQLEGTWSIPVTAIPRGMWVLVKGHGGYLGGGAEAGIRIRLKGNGVGPTWAVTPIVGGEYAFEFDGSSSAGGPSIGLGFDATF